MGPNTVQPHPVFAERLSAIAERLVADGQPEAAAELFEMAAALTPRGEAFRARAAQLRAGPAGDPERIHKRHNLEASHAVGMARIFESRGEFGRAQEMFDLAKLRAPFHYLAYAGAGYVRVRQQDLKGAVEEFIQARRLNPLDRKLAIEAARVALELETYPEALRHAVDALLLTQGQGGIDEEAARRRVDTLAALCRLTDRDLERLVQQRAASLQKASEQVALTRARLFSRAALRRARTASSGAGEARKDLLQLALQLRKLRLFRNFTDPQLLDLAGVSRLEQVRQTQVAIREGQDDADVLLILSGTLETCRSTPIGMQVLGSVGAGEIVGEISFLDGKPRSTTVLATEPVTALRFPAPALRELVRRDNEIRAALLWAFWYSLAAKVRAANSAMTELITPGAQPHRRGTGQRGERVVVDHDVKLSLLREQGLSAAELRLLATYSREERFQPGALIFAEGEQGDTLYIVVEGKVRISRQLDGMGEEALTILGRGEVFGEMALIDDQPRSADARAHVEGCTVFTVDRRRLEEILEMDPDAARQFLTLLCQLMCRRIRAMNDRLVAWRLMASHG